MANERFLMYITIVMVLFVMFEQTYEIYVDCQARCMLTKRHKHHRDTLQTCRDECELFDLLEQEDAKDGKHHQYRLF